MKGGIRAVEFNKYGYFEPSQSIAWQTEGKGIEHVLLTIARRYVGENPPHAPVYRITRHSPIKKTDDHRYSFPIGDIFPHMKIGQKVYAWAKVWVEQEQSFPFLLSCFGPVQLYHNGIKRFGSAREEEGPESAALKIPLQLVNGWNHFFLEFTKAEHGCGGLFGTSNRKNIPLHFLAPSVEREGEEGWIFTEPVEQTLGHLPYNTVPESSTGAAWLPQAENAAAPSGRLDDLYGSEAGRVVYAWSKLIYKGVKQQRVSIQGEAYGPLRIILNGEEKERVVSGPFETKLEVSNGEHDLAIICENAGGGWGFQLGLEGSGSVALSAPVDIKGSKEEWLYLGPFSYDEQPDIADCLSMDTIFKTSGDELIFWRVNATDKQARPFLENELFGKWNYPLGVTLYGMLELSKDLERPELTDYVLRHVEFATALYEYSLWDRKQFGAAGVNNQLSHIDSLDDCGSFGALMILAHKIRALKGAKAAADDIADYIVNVQDRMPDGALYRRVGVSESMHNTMWCDDMYMSVPFLCRYYELSGDARYLDEAARQLLLYKRYLYMPDKQIMSHVYDVKAGKPTLTPWGRGNGWVLFALTELLTVLSQEHADYKDILHFYKELSEGYLRLQGSNGLWHQVLTDPESYEEASCTSMFIYSYARGLRHGWLQNEDAYAYAEAVFAGWQGLCDRAIDQQGNIFGVCKGSSYSFSNYYYKHQLSWKLNDTHGIGIVLLAGLETLRLKKALNMR